VSARVDLPDDVLHRQVRVLVDGPLTAGGAPRDYLITTDDGLLCDLHFHCGQPIEGINGVTHEMLLAVVAHRLTCFQRGPFASVENREALLHVQSALELLRLRTAERDDRGVLGKPEP
jgi:hypothetical protein